MQGCPTMKKKRSENGYNRNDLLAKFSHPGNAVRSQFPAACLHLVWTQTSVSQPEKRSNVKKMEGGPHRHLWQRSGTCCVSSRAFPPGQRRQSQIKCPRLDLIPREKVLNACSLPQAEIKCEDSLQKSQCISNKM